MKRASSILFAAALAMTGVLGASACGKKAEENKAAPTAPTPTPTPTPGSAAPTPGSPDPGPGSAAVEPAAAVEVPTEVDFEVEAASKITEQNLEAQLKAVESELAQQ